MVSVSLWSHDSCLHWLCLSLAFLHGICVPLVSRQLSLGSTWKTENSLHQNPLALCTIQQEESMEIVLTYHFDSGGARKADN